MLLLLLSLFIVKFLFSSDKVFRMITLKSQYYLFVLLLSYLWPVLLHV